MKIEDKKLSTEVEEQLNRLRGYSPKSVFYFVPDVFKKHAPKKEWPVFECTSRDGGDIAEADDMLKLQVFETGQTKSNMGEIRLHILKTSLRGFKNYKDKQGKLVECKYENKDKKIISNESLNKISKDMQLEIIDGINKENKLSEEEKQGLEF